MARMTPAPPIRCRGRGPVRGAVRCGLPAIYAGRDHGDENVAFFCERCARPSDVPLGRVTNVLEVRVSLEVTMTGVSLDETTARAEAIRTPELAIGIAGGRVDVQGVRVARALQHRPGGGVARRTYA